MSVVTVLVVYCRMLQKDLELRDEVLLERDRRIYELKRANQVMPEDDFILHDLYGACSCIVHS